jgi:hypothetical protein
MISGLIGFFQPHVESATNAVASIFTATSREEDIPVEDNNGGEWVDTTPPKPPTSPINMYTQVVVNPPAPVPLIDTPAPSPVVVMPVITPVVTPPQPIIAPIEIVRVNDTPSVQQVVIEPPVHIQQLPIEPPKPPMESPKVEPPVVNPVIEPAHRLVGTKWRPSTNPKKPPFATYTYKIKIQN